MDLLYNLLSSLITFLHLKIHKTLQEQNPLIIILFIKTTKEAKFEL